MKLEYKSVLVTGCAGFIGYHLSKRLLEEGRNVIGVDILNDYYDVRLKNDRLKQLLKNPNFTFYKVDLADQERLQEIFKKTAIDIGMITVAIEVSGSTLFAAVKSSLCVFRGFAD